MVSSFPCFLPMLHALVWMHFSGQLTPPPSWSRRRPNSCLTIAWHYHGSSSYQYPLALCPLICTGMADLRTALAHHRTNMDVPALFPERSLVLSHCTYRALMCLFTKSSWMFIKKKQRRTEPLWLKEFFCLCNQPLFSPKKDSLSIQMHILVGQRSKSLGRFQKCSYGLLSGELSNCS